MTQAGMAAGLWPRGRTGAALLLALVVLAGCGADGAPERPERAAPIPSGLPGVTVTGSVSVGIAGRS